jgi:periplasmic divalent cation tolerance protein
VSFVILLQIVMLIVFTTTPNIAEADSLGAQIVEARLAACVQILPQMTSVYIWEGRIQTEPEHLLLIKTLPEKWDELRDLITANHSYDVPEIVAVDAEKVAEPYRTWLAKNLS